MPAGPLFMAQSHLGQVVLHGLLRRIEIGGLTIEYSAGETHHFGDRASPLQASMRVHDDHLPWEVLTLSELGLGLGYVDGRWTSPSPHHVLLVLILNERKLRGALMRGYRFDLGALNRVVENRRKVRRGDLIEHCREQIATTYDIGNDFYRLMLGPTMTYSCAIWPHEDATLEEAQAYKMDVILDKLGVEPEHRVLDIGCGWGTLCAHIHERTRASVRGIALSRNQIEACRERFPHLDFEYRDYREERGTYDRIVSVGMLEHVGPANLAAFSGRLAGLLRPGGRCLIHWLQPWEGILIDEKRTRHPHWGDVLMPGAESPTQAQMVSAAMATGTLRLLHSETFGIHYARTGRCWLANLERHREEILARHPPELLRAHEYAWHVGSAVMETGYCLTQMVFEKMPYGTSYAGSAVDVSVGRAHALGTHHVRAPRLQASPLEEARR